MNLALVELKTIQWTLTCLSAAAAILFAILSFSSKTTNVVPIINFFISVIMTMYYFYTANLETHLVRPYLFGEMGLNLPLMFLQAISISGAPIQHTLLVFGLQALHVLALAIFTEVHFPQAWIWYSFALIYYIGTCFAAYFGINHAKQKSNRALNIYTTTISALLLSQVIGDANLALLYTKKYGILEYFLTLGLIDFVSRIGLGLYFSLNTDLFPPLNMYITRLAGSKAD